MLNLIRSDLYEMRHTRSFFVCLIVAVLVSVVCIASTSLVRLVYSDFATGEVTAEELALDESDDFFSAFIKGFYTGVTEAEDTVKKIANDNVLEYYEKASTGTLSCVEAMKYSFGDGVTFPMLLSIFISFYVGGEFSKKTINNKISKGCSRAGIYVSKLIVSGVAAIIITLLTAFVYSVMCIIVLGTSNVTDMQIYDYIGTLLCATLVNIAFSSLYVMITVVLKNSVAAVAVNVGFVSTLSMSLSFVDVMSNYQTKSCNFWLGSLLSKLQLSYISPELILNVLLLSGVYITLTTVLGLYSMKKRDI